jgi:glycosyltransferase involved in cell wall biosynthesis
VGTIEPRKNLVRLVEALQLLHKRGLSMPLLVVGGKGWLYDDLFRRLEMSEVKDKIRFSGYVPEGELPLLYGAASVTVMPSLYEGFGLPVLESMACGTPVVSSNAASLPEIGGDAACYFDPTDLESLAGAIQSVWSDAELRAEMRQRGLVQAGRFSWDRAAKETWLVYQRLLQ